MISVVVPIHNEEESLTALHDELDASFCWRVRTGRLRSSLWTTAAATARGASCRAGREDPGVGAIRFRRNFGKAAALSAAFPAARGDLIFTLDADLQDDPAEIPRFLARLEQGRDVVSGWKQTRHDPWHKVFPSRVFNWLVSRLTGCHLHDHNCGLKLYRAEVLREIGFTASCIASSRCWRRPAAFASARSRSSHRPRRHRRVQVRRLAASSRGFST